MSRCILFLLILFASPLLAQSAAPPTQAPPPETPQPDAAPAETLPQTEANPPAEAAAPAAAAPAPEMPPEQRLAQFHHDEINLLALRGDAHSLLAAALMATPDTNDKTRPAALKTAALLTRVQKDAADDPLVWWVTAGVECHAAKK